MIAQHESSRGSIDRSRLKSLFAEFAAKLEAECSPYSIAVFRIGFGLLMAFAILRLFLKGWVHEFYTLPAYHFTYPGFEWVRPLPSPWTECAIAATGLAAVGVALGWFYRLSSLALFVGLVYIELLDQTCYLNHYYLISLIAAWLCVAPAQCVWSCDALKHPHPAPFAACGWFLRLLRFQISVVYLFAGIAKLNLDWLGAGVPLRFWLAARSDLPGLGPWLTSPEVAITASWLGALFDLSVPFFLAHSRARPMALCAVVVFHGATGVLFPIGVFPWIMILCSTVFLDPRWPLQVIHRMRGPRSLQELSTSSSRVSPNPSSQSQPNRPPAPSTNTLWTQSRPVVVMLYALAQVTLPLRPYLDVSPPGWSMDGFNLAWQVMVMDKAGSVRFFVHNKGPHGITRHELNPHEDLTPRQIIYMAQDPYLIRDYARFRASKIPHRPQEQIAITVESFASYNGRPSQRMIDPSVALNLPTQGAWIVPLTGR